MQHRARPDLLVSQASVYLTPLCLCERLLLLYIHMLAASCLLTLCKGLQKVEPLVVLPTPTGCDVRKDGNSGMSWVLMCSLGQANLWCREGGWRWAAALEVPCCLPT